MCHDFNAKAKKSVWGMIRTLPQDDRDVFRVIRIYISRMRDDTNAVLQEQDLVIVHCNTTYSSEKDPRFFAMVEAVKISEPAMTEDGSFLDTMEVTLRLASRSKWNIVTVNTLTKLTTLCPFFKQIEFHEQLGSSSFKDIILQVKPNDFRFQIYNDELSANLCGTLDKEQLNCVQSITHSVVKEDPNIPKIVILDGAPGEKQ